MESLLMRTGSIQAHTPLTPAGSAKLSLSRCNSVSNMFQSSPKISLHLDIKAADKPLRRAWSESDIITSVTDQKKVSRAGHAAFQERIVEEESEYLKWPESGISLEELGFSSGGIDEFGKGKSSDGGNNESNDYGELRKIGDYYKEMLKLNPSDSLLLRNYAKYLHEVEGDMEKAEQYYGRAILASPGDGEVLALYGKLIWDKERDGERAKSYFDQAVSASPNDCMVMGSYAHFLWQADDEEEEEMHSKVQLSPAVAVL